MQPWATLVVMGLKTIETRTWATDYRGPLFIHASKSKAGRGVLESLQLPADFPDFGALPFGFIIGEVVIENIVRGNALPFDEAAFQEQSFEAKAFGDYQRKFCWLLKNAVLFDDPILATGRLGLWEF